MEYSTPSEAPIRGPQRLPTTPPSKIIGRDRELGQIYAQVRAGNAVLLYGPPGAGKTALAATIASAMTALPSGVLWWRVNNDSIDRLVSRLGRAYGANEVADSTTPQFYAHEAALLLKRADKPLVVLDGPLSPAVASEFVQSVAKGVPVIIMAEADISGPWTSCAVPALSDEDAVALLAVAAGYDHDTALQYRADMLGLCKTLGKLPLAVNVVGQHLRFSQRTPGEFLNTLAPTGTSGAMVAIGNAYARLPEALQGVLLSLGATYTGRASVRLLEVLQLSPTETIIHVMDMLVARGLAFQYGKAAGLPIYQLHEVTHRFVQEYLRDTQRLETVQSRVSDALLAHLEAYDGDSREDRDALLAELPNLLALADSAWKREDGDVLGRISDALSASLDAVGGYGYELFVLDGMLNEVVAEIEEDVIEAEQLPFEDILGIEPASSDDLDEHSDEEPVEESPYDTLQLPPSQRVTTIGPPPIVVDHAPYVEEVGTEDVVAAFAVPGEALEFEADDEPESLNAVLRTGGEIELKAFGEAALNAGRRQDAAAALFALGQQRVSREAFDEAQDDFTEALVLYEDLDDHEGMLTTLEVLAALCLDTGDLDNAIVYATRAENLGAEANDPGRYGHVLALLGDIRLELNETGGAIEAYVDAIETLQSTEDQLSLGIVQTKLGNAYLDQRNYSRAITMLTAALHIFEQEGRKGYEGHVLDTLGTAYGMLGEWKNAAEYHQNALIVARSTGDVDAQERQLANLAYIAQQLNDRAGTLKYFRQALGLAFQAEEVVWQVRYLDVLGRMLMDDVSTVALAVMLMEEAEGLMPDEDRARLLGRARRRLDRARTSGIRQVPAPRSIAQWAADAM